MTASGAKSAGSSQPEAGSIRAFVPPAAARTCWDDDCLSRSEVVGRQAVARVDDAHMQRPCPVQQQHHSTHTAADVHQLLLQRLDTVCSAAACTGRTAQLMLTHDRLHQLHPAVMVQLGAGARSKAEL